MRSSVGLPPAHIPGVTLAGQPAKYPPPQGAPSMQTAMLRLDRTLRRRKRAVLIVWAVIVLAAVPFAARQSEDLSSGGFGVPGSQSAAVGEALAGFHGVQRAELAAVLVPEPGATPAQLRAAVDRVAAAAGPVDGVALTAAERERAVARG